MAQDLPWPYFPPQSHVIRSIRDARLQFPPSLYYLDPTSSQKKTLEYLKSIKLEPYIFPFCHNVYKTMPGTSRHRTNPILYTFSQKWIWIEGSQWKVLSVLMLSGRIISMPLSF